MTLLYYSQFSAKHWLVLNQLNDKNIVTQRLFKKKAIHLKGHKRSEISSQGKSELLNSLPLTLRCHFQSPRMNKLMHLCVNGKKDHIQKQIKNAVTAKSYQIGIFTSRKVSLESVSSQEQGTVL